MNKYDELLNTLLMEQDVLIKNRTKLNQEKEALEKTKAQKEKVLNENKQKYEELEEIKNTLENFSFKVPKKFIYRRLIAYGLTYLVAIVFCLLLGLVLSLFKSSWGITTFVLNPIKEGALTTMAFAPLIIILEQACETFQKRDILKRYKYEKIVNILNNLVRDSKELTKSIEKDEENIEIIDNKREDETSKIEAIKTKINQVSTQKYKTLVSLVNTTYDQDLSAAYENDPVIKRVLEKEKSYE